MPRTRPGLPLVCAVTAGLTAAVLLTVGPPGIDTPAHLFMTWVFRHAGFQLWNNYWYDGRYDFVGYSLLFYPLAAAVGRVGFGGRLVGGAGLLGRRRRPARVGPGGERAVA